MAIRADALSAAEADIHPKRSDVKIYGSAGPKADRREPGYAKKSS